MAVVILAGLHRRFLSSNDHLAPSLPIQGQPLMTFMYMSSSLLALIALPTLTTAYTWNFKTTPQQCSNLTIEISGADGKPPYRVLILPFGPTPLGNNVEARRILDQPFSENSTSVSFKLNYPAHSQFVAVVSLSAISSPSLSCLEPRKRWS